MRVLFWSDLYWPYIGGAEVFAAKLMASLRARGVDFLVVTSHHDRDLPDVDVYEGIPIRRLPFRDAISGRDAKALVNAISQVAAIKREFDPDVVHMNAVGPSAFFHLRTSPPARTPLIVTLQQEVLTTQLEGASTLMAQVLDAAAWVVGCSGTVLDQARAAHPAIEERSSCIYNGVDIPDLEPAPLPQLPHVVCLGRLVSAKGFDVALRAFAKVAAGRSDALMTVAGDGVLREELRSLADELGIATRVAFTGWVDPADVPALLNTASVVVMPSRREGMPVVAAQAALMGRPVISTNAGGLREIILDGDTGVVVPAEDPVALAAALERLLGDRNLASTLGQRARAHATRVLDWDGIVSSYHELYSSGGSRSHARN